jgi:hypothetical protein
MNTERRNSAMTDATHGKTLADNMQLGRLGREIESVTRDPTRQMNDLEIYLRHAVAVLDAQNDEQGKTEPKTCSAPGCHNPAKVRRSCRTHYCRWLRGVPVYDTPVQPKLPAGSQQECKEEGCTRPAKSRYLCNAHYMRTLLNLEITGPIRARRKKTHDQKD